MALYDGLTGIPNRRHFDHEFDREFRRSARVGQPIAAIMLDLDNFKPLNDTEGHDAGDACLARVAIALSEQMRRPGDIVARYGGDEFVVCLPDTDLSGATKVAARLCQAVESLGIGVGEASETAYRVGATVGVASEVPTAESGDPVTLLKTADRALYQNKVKKVRPGVLGLA